MSLYATMNLHGVISVQMTQSGLLQMSETHICRTRNIVVNTESDQFTITLFSDSGEALCTDREEELQEDLDQALADRDTERARAEAAEQELRDLRAEIGPDDRDDPFTAAEAAAMQEAAEQELRDYRLNESRG